jgi:hypothetical protein
VKIDVGFDEDQENREEGYEITSASRNGDFNQSEIFFGHNDDLNPEQILCEEFNQKSTHRNEPFDHQTKIEQNMSIDTQDFLEKNAPELCE